MAAPVDNSTELNSFGSSALTGEGVVIDIGTGDGRFVYRTARKHPRKFFIGIDPNPKPLEKISMRATRKPKKGGAPNVMFVQAAIEELPEELNGVADEIHIHFPWGSLLGAVATGERKFLRSLRRISTDGCFLEIILGLDRVKDAAEIERLQLDDFTIEHFVSFVAPLYDSSGFRLNNSRILRPDDWSSLESSWARRLSQATDRTVFLFVFEAV